MSLSKGGHDWPHSTLRFLNTVLSALVDRGANSFIRRVNDVDVAVVAVVAVVMNGPSLRGGESLTVVLTVATLRGGGVGWSFFVTRERGSTGVSVSSKDPPHVLRFLITRQSFLGDDCQCRVLLLLVVVVMATTAGDSILHAFRQRGHSHHRVSLA